MHGFGIHKFKDGKRYEGEWQLGKKHGVGISFSADGKASKDNWNNGRIMR